MPVSLLLIEDNEDILANLYAYLEPLGYELDCARHGRTGLSMALEGRFDCIVLDVMLPGLDGVSLCRNLREEHHSAVPVLMLTARGEEMDRVVGLSLGADDYVVKPFSVRELMLRIKAILRRGGRAAENALLERHGIRLRPDAHTASSGERKLVLTATEFRLLEDLLRHAGTVRTREQLLNNVWGYSFEGYARTVDTHVRRLRSKLGEAAAALETVRGVGYRWEAEKK